MLSCPRYLAVLYLDISELVFEWLKCLQHLRENVLRCFKCVLNFRKREPSYTDSVLLVAKNILILCHVYALPVLSNIKDPIRNRISLRFLDITTVIHNICFLNVLIEKANHFDFIKTMGIGSIYKIKSVSFFRHFVAVVVIVSSLFKNTIPCCGFFYMTKIFFCSFSICSKLRYFMIFQQKRLRLQRTLRYLYS